MSGLNTPNKLHPPIRTDMVRSSEEQFASEPSVQIFSPLKLKTCPQQLRGIMYSDCVNAITFN